MNFGTGIVPRKIVAQLLLIITCSQKYQEYLPNLCKRALCKNGEGAGYDRVKS